MQFVLPIHIAAGALAIVLGAVALSVRKGGTMHRRSGRLRTAQDHFVEPVLP